MGANLTNFVGDVYDLHAHPILITALSRRNFVNETNKIDNLLADWAAGEAAVDTCIALAEADTSAPFVQRRSEWLQRPTPPSSLSTPPASTTFKPSVRRLLTCSIDCQMTIPISTWADRLCSGGEG
jgi:hypothetical protein